MESDLRKLGEQKVSGMILDLRGNPGGLVNEAVAVAGRFLRDGQWWFRTTAAPKRSRFSAPSGGRRRRSIRSWCWWTAVGFGLGDCFRRAAGSRPRLVMGDTTFGKGLVQAQFPLSEGARCC